MPLTHGFPYVRNLAPTREGPHLPTRVGGLPGTQPQARSCLRSPSLPSGSSLSGPVKGAKLLEISGWKRRDTFTLHVLRFFCWKRQDMEEWTEISKVVVE